MPAEAIIPTKRMATEMHRHHRRVDRELRLRTSNDSSEELEARLNRGSSPFGFMY